MEYLIYFIFKYLFFLLFYFNLFLLFYLNLFLVIILAFAFIMFLEWYTSMLMSCSVLFKIWLINIIYFMKLKHKSSTSNKI